MTSYENYAALDKRINEGGKPLVIEFSAEWCGKCKMLAPIFAKVGEAMAEKAEFASVDVDAVPEAADRLGILNLPTIVVIKEGAVVHQSSGLLNEGSLTALLETLLG